MSTATGTLFPQPTPLLRRLRLAAADAAHVLRTGRTRHDESAAAYLAGATNGMDVGSAITINALQEHGLIPAGGTR